MNTGERIRQIRELRGWTQTQLAQLIDKDQSTIAQIEGGRFEASDEIIKLVAFASGFPPSFFRQEQSLDFPLGSLALRAHATLTRREKLRAYRYAQLTFEFADKIGKDVSRVPVSLPRVDADPLEAARVTRSQLGLSPDRPIGHLVNTVEKMGVLILLLPLNFPHLDAFSLWAGPNKNVPVMAVAASRPGDRQRFSISHELWHLISIPRGTPQEIEKNADKFAAEFLTPIMGIKREMISPFTLTEIAKLKARWGVSMQSLIRRAAELEVISDRQYRYLMQQMSMRGWRRKEPVDVPYEKPTAFPRIIEKAKAGSERLGSETSYPTSFIKSTLAAYIVSS